MGDFTWSLLKKVKEDVRNLLKAFESKNSLRFTDFSEAWREAKFSLIFRKRNSFAELLEFCEEIFHITKEYLLPAHEFVIRVGALYTLYGLYFKQPLKQPAKIRLTKSEWENLSDVIDQCKREHHIDAVFIHLKLFFKQAYLFTATERPMGLEIGYRKYYSQKGLAFTDSNKLDDPSENPIIEPGFLDQLSKMVSLYAETKSVAAGNSDPQLIDENFAKHLKDQCTIQKMRKEVSRRRRSDDEIIDDSNDEDWRPELEEDQQKKSIGARRTKLKQKSFSSQKKDNAEGESVAVEESSQAKKPKVLKSFVIAQKKAQALIRQKEMISADPQPGQSSAPEPGSSSAPEPGPSSDPEPGQSSAPDFTLPQSSDPEPGQSSAPDLTLPQL